MYTQIKLPLNSLRRKRRELKALLTSGINPRCLYASYVIHFPLSVTLFISPSQSRTHHGGNNFEKANSSYISAARPSDGERNNIIRQIANCTKVTRRGRRSITRRNVLPRRDVTINHDISAKSTGAVTPAALIVARTRPHQGRECARLLEQ